MATSDHAHHHVKKTVNWLLIIVVCIFVVFLVQVFRTPSDRLTKIINDQGVQKIDLRLRNLKISAELARTPSERARGLSKRSNLPEFAGMLFVFATPTTPQFWMKDTLFPLDLIWIGQDLKIIGIEHNVSPESFPTTFSPDKPVRYVLEVNAGLTDNFNINPGDDVGL